ncbi:MAG: hypothetical protein LUG50_06870 [Planctomycetaceae bacterium]|nr:hypothetical protein [Planctomycetaceae bacterium]
MPAPKGNKNAMQGTTKKTAGYRLSMTPENHSILVAISQSQKISLAKVIENALVKAYPKEFKDKF